MFRLENILSTPLDQMTVDELSDVVKRLEARQTALRAKQDEAEQMAMQHLGYKTIADARDGLKAYGSGKIRENLDTLREFTGAKREPETAKALALGEQLGLSYLKILDEQVKNTRLYQKADLLRAEKSRDPVLTSHAYRG